MPSTTTSSNDQASQPSYGLQLPTAAFSKVAPYSHLAAHLFPATASPHKQSQQQSQRPPRRSLRPSGRTPSQFRTPSCTTDTLAHCAGSAVVRLEHGTSVVCGIQAEILTLPPTADNLTLDGQQRRRSDHDREASDRTRLASLNLLVPNVDLATGADSEHLPTTGSGAPSAEAQVLSSRILSLLLRSNLIELDALRICGGAESASSGRQQNRQRSGADDMDVDTSSSDSSSSSSSSLSSPTPSQTPEAFWVLHISLLTLSLSGRTSLFDALWASLIAALRTTRLPHADWDADAERVLCDPEPSHNHTLATRGCPLTASWGVFVAPAGRIRMLEGGGGDDVETVQVRDGSNRKVSAYAQGWDTPRRLPNGALATLLADPEEGEDELCQETLTLVVDCECMAHGTDEPKSKAQREAQSKTKILSIDKKGGPLISFHDVNSLLPSAEQRWKEWRAVMP